VFWRFQGSEVEERSRSNKRICLYPLLGASAFPNICEMEQKLLVKKIETIEKELGAVKSLILSSKKKIISLKGLFNGMTVTDQDLQEARGSVFYSL